jgi:TatD DNase family protein
MTMALVDTHCHLDIDAFDADRDAVIRRAIDDGVTRMIVPTVDMASLPRVIELAERYPAIYAAVGIHPNDIPLNVTIDEIMECVRQAAEHPKVVALGEIGLDYYWDARSSALQLQWLERQLDLAAEMRLPVILHSREAASDTITVLARWIEHGLPDELNERPGVLHSFSSTLEDAETILEMGFYLGLTGPITFKNAEDLRQVAAHVPLDRILLETDSPYLTPHPQRGQRNEPAYVRFVAEKLASIRSADVEIIGRQTTHNAQYLFGLK